MNRSINTVFTYIKITLITMPYAIVINSLRLATAITAIVITVIFRLNFLHY